MQSFAPRIFSQAVGFGEYAAVGRMHDPGDRGVLREPFLVHQQFERAKAPASGRNLIIAGLLDLPVEKRPDVQALSSPRRAMSSASSAIVSRGLVRRAFDCDRFRRSRGIRRAACARPSRRGRAYPIARGTAPLLVTLGAAPVTRELPGAAGLTGIACISSGITLLALGGNRPDMNQLLRPL